MKLYNKIQEAIKSDPLKYLRISGRVVICSGIIGVSMMTYALVNLPNIPESVEQVQKLTSEIEWEQFSLKNLTEPSFVDSINLYAQKIESSIDSIVADPIYQSNRLEYEKSISEHRMRVIGAGSFILLSLLGVMYPFAAIDQKYGSIIREQRIQEQKYRSIN